MPSTPANDKLKKGTSRPGKKLVPFSGLQQGPFKKRDWARLFIDSAPYGIMVHDKKGAVLVFNPQLEKISGYRAKEIDTIFVWIEKVYPDNAYRQLVLAERKKADRHKGLRVKEAVITRKSGEKRHCQFSSFALASGLRIVFIQDIEDQKQVQETEKSFQAMIDDIPALICRFLPDGTLTFVNNRYCNYFHKDKTELIGHNFFQFIPLEDRLQVRRHFTSLNPKHPMTTYEHKVISPEGSIRWQRWTDRALFDARGKIHAYQSIGIDITDWKTTETALRESEEKFRTVTEKSPNMIFIFKDNRIVYCNQQCEEMIQYSRDQVCSLEFDFRSIIAPESADELISDFKKHMRGKPVKPSEYTLVDRDGKRIAVIIKAKRINYEGSRAILGIVTDITKQKQTEESLRKKDRKLRRQALSLQETNTALKVLIEHREKEKAALEQNIQKNVDQLILPYVEKLERASISATSKQYLEALKTNLKELVSSFASTLSSEHIALTPAELQIANFIKQGKTSKEIAGILNVTVKAVSFHRGNIRKKLGLSNQKINLRSRLQTLPLPRR